MYPSNSHVAEGNRLLGEHNAIMIEYLTGEQMTPENFTEELGSKALEGLSFLHEKSILHGDINDWNRVRNVFIEKGGHIKWYDFDRLIVGHDSLPLIPKEWERAVQLLKGDGDMYNLK